MISDQIFQYFCATEDLFLSALAWFYLMRNVFSSEKKCEEYRRGIIKFDDNSRLDDSNELARDRNNADLQRRIVKLKETSRIEFWGFCKFWSDEVLLHRKWNLHRQVDILYLRVKEHCTSENLFSALYGIRYPLAKNQIAQLEKLKYFSELEGDGKYLLYGPASLVLPKRNLDVPVIDPESSVVSLDLRVGFATGQVYLDNLISPDGFRLIGSTKRFVPGEAIFVCASKPAGPVVVRDMPAPNKDDIPTGNKLASTILRANRDRELAQRQLDEVAQDTSSSQSTSRPRRNRGNAAYNNFFDATQQGISTPPAVQSTGKGKHSSNPSEHEIVDLTRDSDDDDA
jgi:hypothetical protein